MSAGAIAGLIAAGAFGVLALVGCVVLLKLGRIFDQVADRVKQTDQTIDEGTARVRQAGTTVDEVNQALSQVNVELARVDAIASNVQSITGNVSALTGVVATAFGGPVVKVAAFSYGVRQATAARRRNGGRTQQVEVIEARRARASAAGRSHRVPR